jgi:hypothetical protein
MAANPQSKPPAALNVGGISSKVRSRTNTRQNYKDGEEITKRPLYDLVNASATRYRTEGDIPRLIRELAKREGPISSAVHQFVEVASSGFLITAYDPKTGAFHPEGTTAANAIAAALDTPFIYTDGFVDKMGMETLSKHMLREVVLTGGLGAELVLNSALQPDYVQVVPYETLIKLADGKGRTYPAQRSTDGKNNIVSLDIPNFFLSEMHRDAGSEYAFSMMESAIKLVVAFEEFLEDIRRSVRQNGHTRTIASLDLDKICKAAPQAIQKDSVKLMDWANSIKNQFESALRVLNPEDMLVYFNTADVQNLQSNLGSRMDYTPLLNTMAGLYSTSMKTPPTAIGLRLEGGSQALGNVESLLYLKTAASIQTPVEVVLSRILTMACRLRGIDVFVNLQFKPIDLRPDTELSSFRTMEQTRIYEQLSYGFISDELAAHLLGTGPRPPGAPKLSGTMFMQSGGKQNDPALGDTAMGRTLQPDKKVPRKAGGKSQ